MQLTPSKAAIVANLVSLFESANAPGDQASLAFHAAFDAFLDNDDFSFEECEYICMLHGWA